MTSSEDEKRKQFMALYGSITDPTFDVPPDLPLTESDNVDLFGDDDAVSSTDTSCPVADDIDFEAVREKLITSTNSERMRRILSHFGRISDPAFRRYPETPISSYAEV